MSHPASTVTPFHILNGLVYDAIPAPTRTIVKQSLLDILGVMAGARRTRTSRRVSRYVLDHYRPGVQHSRLFFDGSPVSALGAAWQGGFMADSLDAHEGHFTSKGHAGATVVPALLALVDAYADGGRTLSGERFLCLLAIAYETALRAGVALARTANDYHASGAFSGLGVVCAGQALLELNEPQFNHALGIAEYFGPRCPMMRLIDHPSMLRDAHGAGAYAGVNALLLARAGITGGPAETVASSNVQDCWSDLGTHWEIDSQYFKPWPVCRWAQPALTAAEKLIQSHPEVRHQDVTRVRVETFHESMRLQGYNPANDDEAQYALAFPLAAYIVRRCLGPGEVTGKGLEDIQVLALCQKIEITEAGDLSARFPKVLCSRVTIELKDGRRLDSGDTLAKGDPDNPMTVSELTDKFYHLGADSLSRTHLNALYEAVSQLDRQPDCRTLLDLVFNNDGKY